MVAVQLSGGLGNQMFEYALYLKLKSMGKEVKIDDFTCYGEQEQQRTNQLSVFGVSYERLSKEEYEKLTDSSLRPADRLRRKLLGRRDLSYREASCNFDPEVLSRKTALLTGYFQSEKYFADIRDQVREAFRFRERGAAGVGKAGTKGNGAGAADEAAGIVLPPEQLQLLSQIQSCEAVSVHIRRGDYLSVQNQAMFGGICDDAYYDRAIAEMKRRLPGAVFFFFSNDTDWVKERYRGENCVVAEGNGEDAGFRDLFLMSQCRHHIMANSSFSWWGAWLDENPDQIVIAPKKWFNDRECRDIYTDRMIRM